MDSAQPSQAMQHFQACHRNSAVRPARMCSVAYLEILFGGYQTKIGGVGVFNHVVDLTEPSLA